MSWTYPDIEAAAETAIRSLLISAGVTTTILTAWNDESGAAAEESRVLPLVTLSAEAAIPQGWQRGQHETPVTIGVFTHFDDDPNRTALKALYRQIRGALESMEFTVAGFDFFALQIVGGTAPDMVTMPGGNPATVNAVTIQCMVSTCFSDPHGQGDLTTTTTTSS